MMNEYQVIARKFRPHRFSEVVGQEATVTTLVNAIKMKRVAHAYLFSGSRGTGKTTLARIFSKALNCKDLSADCEPCNQCASCKEIDGCHAIDVIEIDGASHRGIEDVRQINETTLYAPTQGKYKIFIIDEVHMLTKEAFNALLKSLEEPPERVKFFFATTEPHKIPATIISRCQRFNLVRIPPHKMVGKLSRIAHELGVEITPDALEVVAALSGGGLRDAESLFDQLISYYGTKITRASVEELFGILPQEKLYALDKAFVEQDYTFPFKMADDVIASGKSVELFIEELVSHFRKILLKKIPPYTEEQALDILEMLSQVENEIKHAFSQRTTLEMTLVKILRSAKRLSLESIVERLQALEKGGPSLEKEMPKKEMAAPPAPVKKEVVPPTPAPAQPVGVKERSRFDTVTRFAAKELSGTLKKEL